MTLNDYLTEKLVVLLEDNNKRQIAILNELQKIGRDIAMIKSVNLSKLTGTSDNHDQ